MADNLDIELKLESIPVAGKKLDSLPFLHRTRIGSEHLISTYFDTANLRLRKNDFSLRVRRIGKSRIQTVKAGKSRSAGPSVQPEWERTLADDTPILDDSSGPLPAMLCKMVAGKIKPIFVTDIKRTTYDLRFAEADIECTITEGEVRAGPQVEPICEIELELKGGTTEALFDLARALNDVVPLRLGVRAKSERGYGLIAGGKVRAYKAEPLILDPEGDAGDAFLAIANSCIRQFRLNEMALMATGAPEALHQARVALRRLRSAMSLYKPLFAHDDRGELLRIELRQLAAILGEVRNIDVLIPRVGDEVRPRLHAARRHAFEHMQIELNSSRTRLMMLDLAEWLAVGAWRSPNRRAAELSRNVVPFACDLLEKRRRRVERRGHDLAGLSDEDRHAVRIEAKKLRYAVDFYASLYPRKKQRVRFKQFQEALAALQDCLGELNDLAVGPELLEKLGIDFELPPTATGEERAGLLARAGEAYNALMDAKCFWRA